MTRGIPQFDRGRMSLDPRDPAFYRNPWPAYALMHARGASHVWEQYGYRSFCAHADVLTLLRDRRLGRPDDPNSPRPSRNGLETFDHLDRLSLLELEPPHHTTLRRRITRAFVSRSVGALEPFVRRRANELIDGFGDGPVDLLARYAAIIPAETVALHLGIPIGDAPRLVAWSHAMVAMYQFDADEGTRQAAEAASREFAAYLTEQVERVRRDPGQNLLMELARMGDDALSDDEVVATAILLLNAGHEATVHQIGNAVLAILRHGAAGRTSAEGTDALVEECMRYEPPLHLFTRTAYKPIDWVDADGTAVRIENGETIGLLLGAANRDPRRFDDPDAFDPTRQRNDHMSFGGGIHFCIGAPLARMEIGVAVGALFERLPDLRLAGEPSFADSFHFHGLERLDVRW